MCNEQIVGWVTEWRGVDTPKTVITTKDPAVLKKVKSVGISPGENLTLVLVSSLQRSAKSRQDVALTVLKQY